MRNTATRTCKACGQPGTSTDPTVTVDGQPIHRSHTTDPNSGLYGADCREDALARIRVRLVLAVVVTVSMLAVIAGAAGVALLADHHLTAATRDWHTVLLAGSALLGLYATETLVNTHFLDAVANGLRARLRDLTPQGGDR